MSGIVKSFKGIVKSFIRRFAITQKSAKILMTAGIILFLMLVFFYIFNSFFGYDPYEITRNILEPPDSNHIMGTDQLGRDIFSRMCYGTSSSLAIALIASVISLIIGAPMGAVSGYFAGPTDRILSVIFDALYAFPGIILAVLIAVMLGPGVYTTSIAISVEFIPQYFRVVRGLSLSLKERPFVEAIKALGARSRNLVFQHILVYAVPSIVALVMLNMGSAILAVSGLGFLGLGLPPPTPEWGTDLGRGRDFITMGVWWASTFPGLMIVISVVAFTLIGEGLNEMLKTSISGVKM